MERRENDERTKRFQKKKEIVQRVMDNTEIEEHLDMLVVSCSALYWTSISATVLGRKIVRILLSVLGLFRT